MCAQVVLQMRTSRSSEEGASSARVPPGMAPRLRDFWYQGDPRGLDAPMLYFSKSRSCWSQKRASDFDSDFILSVSSYLVENRLTEFHSFIGIRSVGADLYFYRHLQESPDSTCGTM